MTQRGNSRRYAPLTALPTIELVATMKIIQYIDRILWATRVASITSPTYVDHYMPHDVEPRPAGSSHAGASRSALHDRNEVSLANA